MIIYYCWQKTSTLIAAVCGTVYLDTGFIHEEPTIYMPIIKALLIHNIFLLISSR